VNVVAHLEKGHEQKREKGGPNECNGLLQNSNQKYGNGVPGWKKRKKMEKPVVGRRGGRTGEAEVKSPDIPTKSH